MSNEPTNFEIKVNGQWVEEIFVETAEKARELACDLVGAPLSAATEWNKHEYVPTIEQQVSTEGVF